MGNGGSRNGKPDRLLCYKGRFIAVELKDDLKGKYGTSDNQEIEIANIQRSGGIAVVIDSVDTLIEILDKIDRGEL